MLRRDEFNLLEGFYMLTHIGKANYFVNESQYMLSVYFTKIANNDITEIRNNFCVKQKYLNFNYLNKSNAIPNPNIHVLFSPKELPHLIYNSVWDHGQCQLVPKDYLPKYSTTLYYNWPKDATENKKIFSNYKDNFDLSFEHQNVFNIKPKDLDINLVIPVYEVIRAFYCEDSKVADACFQGKSIVNVGMSYEGRELLNVSDSCGYVVLEKHIKDDQAWLGYRLLSNPRYQLEFSKVHVSLKNKNNNGPLIDFPIEWETNLSFHGYYLNRNNFYVCQITNYTDFSHNINEFKYGRVNDSRKGKNSNSNELISQNSGRKKLKFVAEIGDFNVLSDQPIAPNVVEIDITVDNCIVNRPQGLSLNKIDKDFQVYQNEDYETYTTTDGISLASTSNDFFDGSLAGGVYLNGLGKAEDKNFENKNNLLIRNLLIYKKTRAELKIEALESTIEKDGIDKYRWSHLKKVNNNLYKHPRKIAFIQFTYKNNNCFLIEIQRKSSESTYTLGIAVGKIDLDTFSFAEILYKIKLQMGRFPKLEGANISGMKFSFNKHKSDPKEMMNLVFNTIDELCL